MKKISEEERDRERYKLLASRLPLLQGTIVTREGVPVDIADIFDVPKTPTDPQLEKAQANYPYISDTIILENGRTCSLFDIFTRIFEISDLKTIETEQLRLTRVELSDADWRVENGN